MSNRVEPEIPNISLDDDMVKPAQKASKPTSSQSPAPQSKAPTKASGALVFFTVAIYAALAGTGYFFYQENLKLQATINDSQDRIQQLEDQLSATGEEMGESTVALKAKLQAISEKTEKLWEEMDKLWASAWRRNQSEIKDLTAQNKKLVAQDKNMTGSIDTLAKSVKDVKDKQTATDFNVEALSEQLQSAGNIQSELNKVKDDLATLKQRIQGRDSQQMEVATSVNSLDMQLKLLLERIESLEKKPASVTPATKQAAGQ
ncbi:hypothetical protein [Thalassotalea marina]|uniref:Uncharacterized protein n=1 Tax=Thalassotalea marina TaxID=1673741 RepID=A0A919BIB5_9GAMM|nr:hypothetical protein [Thalassotalea marina]GHF92976.1 hypothetical protein GCM10017161_21490 [Thalassotalea marina]